MISSYAECDNCKYLLKVGTDTKTPPGWAVLTRSYRSGNGLDASVGTQTLLLCGDCESAARTGLRAATESAA